jgi:hypothetical protein
MEFHVERFSEGAEKSRYEFGTSVRGDVFQAPCLKTRVNIPQGLPMYNGLLSE